MLSQGDFELLQSITDGLVDFPEISVQIEALCNNCERYLLHIDDCRLLLLKSCTSLIRRDHILLFMRLYCHILMLGRHHAFQEDVFGNLTSDIPIEMIIFKNVFICTLSPNSIEQVADSISALLTFWNGPTDHLLHSIVQSAHYIDHYMMNENVLADSKEKSNRHWLFNIVKKHSALAFFGYLKTAYLAFWTSLLQDTDNLQRPTTGRVPQIFREYHTAVGMSKQDNDVLTSALCEILVTYPKTQTENSLFSILSLLEEMVPPNISADIITKHIVSASSKASTRRSSIKYLMIRLEDFRNEALMIDFWHCTDNAPSLSAPSVSKWGSNKSIFLTKLTTKETHKKIISETVSIICAASLDSLALDPSEAVRLGILSTIFSSLESFTDNACIPDPVLNHLKSHLFQTVLMKCNDKSAKIRTKAAALMVSKREEFFGPSSDYSCSAGFGKTVTAEKYYLCLRNYLRVSNSTVLGYHTALFYYYEISYS